MRDCFEFVTTRTNLVGARWRKMRRKTDRLNNPPSTVPQNSGSLCRAMTGNSKEQIRTRLQRLLESSVCEREKRECELSI